VCAWACALRRMCSCALPSRPESTHAQMPACARAHFGNLARSPHRASSYLLHTQSTTSSSPRPRTCPRSTAAPSRSRRSRRTSRRRPRPPTLSTRSSPSRSSPRPRSSRRGSMTSCARSSECAPTRPHARVRPLARPAQREATRDAESKHERGSLARFNAEPDPHHSPRSLLKPPRSRPPAPSSTASRPPPRA
jgi:hypothetical protein